MKPRSLFASLLLLTAFAVSARAQAIVGAWSFGTTSGNSTTTGGVFVFLTNGTYYHVQTGPDDSGGTSGVERGTYTWNSSTGILSYTNPPIVDTNGTWGFSNNGAGAQTIDFDVAGNVLTVNNTSTTFARVTGSDAITGAWSFGTTSGNNTTTGGVFVFLANGTYYHVQTGPDDSGGTSGVERGTYTWNSSTGILSYTNPPIVDTNGTWGFSNNGAGAQTIDFDVAGNVLTVNNTSTTFARVTAVPEPSTYAASAGLGALGLVAWRRRSARLAA